MMHTGLSPFDETKDFVIKTAHLRENEKFGVVTKGLVCLDWYSFKHLPGSYYMGKCSKAVTHNRVDRKNKIWRYNKLKAFKFIKYKAQPIST